MKAILVLALLFVASALCSLGQSASVYSNQQSPIIEYGLEKLEEALKKSGESFEVARTPEAALRIFSEGKPLANSNDGYSIFRESEGLAIRAKNDRGAMYGLLDIAEQLDWGTALPDIENKTVDAHHPFRAIKFNLPWFPYRAGEHLSLHIETCRDLSFWEAFLDMMAENRFNTLTLWNLHPYMYMVKPPSFPDASPFTDEEMAEWQAFWKGLFGMAKERGIETYTVNWNIFVSEKFAQNYGGKDLSESAKYIGDGETNENIERYTRELITETINTYEDLTGIGITLGERMGGMTSEQRRDWIDRTIIAGLKDADREARLIYRAPLSANKRPGGSTSVTTEQLTRDTVENMGLKDDVWIEFKFNWSHAHSSPRLSIVHGGMLTDTYWDPLSDKYKAVWTMRNEDFFVLRWAQPDFIREFIGLNSQPYVGGCIIGSECYIPAKDYITQEQYQLWDYAFERQWLFYKVWGHLLFNPLTPDAYFETSLAQKFPEASGPALLQAWKFASMNANRLASFYRATWDATLYSEAFANRPAKLISIDELINSKTLDPKYISIKEFVDPDTDQASRISPLFLARESEVESDEALRIATGIKQSATDQELLIELNDIETWAWHGKYFAAKLRGGVALESYRQFGNPLDQREAINQLTTALECWEQVIAHVERYNKPVQLYQFDQEFSWRKQLPIALNDIEVARDATVVKE